MASGCIVANCWICGEPVYEDEVDFIGENFVHDECKQYYTGHADEFKKLISMYKAQKRQLEKMMLDLERIYERIDADERRH